MSSTARRSVSSQLPGVSPSERFTAKFVLLNGISIAFSGYMNIAVLAFNSAKMILTYAKNSQLVGKHAFSGTIGAVNFTITLDSSPTIAGPIEGGPEDCQCISGTVFLLE